MIASEKLAVAPAVTSMASSASEEAARPAPVAEDGPKPLLPGELKYRLTLLLFPSILLIFVALYVASLTSGAEPEVSLMRAGAASVVLAILGRVAVGILGDERQGQMNEHEEFALAQTHLLQDQMNAAVSAGAPKDAEDATQAGAPADDGGKE
jgi:hypothetical protein